MKPVPGAAEWIDSSRHATFGTLDDQVDLAAVGCTQGLGRTRQRGGDRVHLERAEIGDVRRRKTLSYPPPSCSTGHRGT